VKFQFNIAYHLTRQASVLILFFLLGNMPSFSQTDELKNSIIEQRIEEIAGNLDEGAELDYTNLFEDLTYYYEHPLNLNSATTEELRELYILTDLQITNLQKHLERYGSLRSIYELQAVESFDPNTIRNISYFVTVKPTLSLRDFSFQNFFKEVNHDLFLRYKRNIEQQVGFLPDPQTGVPEFVGSPDYMYTRYRMQYRKSLRVGFTMEKDPGESNADGPDFKSFHALYTGKSWLRKLVVGDYQVLFGQGLTFWNGLAFGKSGYVLNVKRNAVGLRPYSSVQEGNFLRGAATTLGMGKMELTSFYSFRKLDANVALAVDTLVADDDFVATSLPLTGLHRTQTEIALRNVLEETIYGGNLKYSSGSFSVGATAVRTQFNTPLFQDPNDLYKKFRFQGSNNLNLGVDYQGVIRNANFFGEFSRSQNGGFSAINGMVAAVHPRLSISAVHRWYGADYQALRTNVFGENNTTANNERGLFVGAQANLTGKFTLTAYSDLVKFPWLQFRSDASTKMSDYLVQLNYKPDRKNEFYFRYRIRNKEQNSGDPDLQITYVVPTVQENWRIHGVYQVHPNVQMKTRAEWTVFKKEGVRDNGFLIYQDVIFKKMGSKMTFSGRYALFDTNDWNSRLYGYESDVLYAFSILPYVYKGSRAYAMVKWDIARGVDLWLRYGTWIYTDRNVISSGNSQINGNQKSDVHIQLRLQF
jgi:hypothetical protein